jgi:feruloyl-CoA synthase
MAVSRILPSDTVITRAPDGVLYARSPYPLPPYPDKITERLEHWAVDAPDRPFLARRNEAGSWRILTYGAALSRTRSIAQALISRHLSPDRPLVILSGNSIEHALMALAAMYAGVPYSPIAPAYSLLAREFTTLRYLWAVLEPGLVFAAEGDRYAAALASLDTRRVEVVTCSGLGAAGSEDPALQVARGATGSEGPALQVARGAMGSEGPALQAGTRSSADSVARGLQTPRPFDHVTPFAELEQEHVTAAVDAAHQKVTPDSVAKILFTSGSTGRPKGVINTQRMLCANQEMLRTVLPMLADPAPVLCDWLPWNHTFGGNHNFGIVLYNGGTLYIDDGKPTPEGFETTVTNLREIASTAYFNVPRGYDLLVPRLQKDAAFARHFFSRLQMLFCAAASLRQQVADDLVSVAIDSRGERIPLVTGLGATESAPFALCAGDADFSGGRIGVPVPGVELKAAPVGEQLEARLRGPTIAPGYWRDPALTRAAFDDEGFYRMGDAIAFAVPGDPAAGFTFQGRINEDFKLSTGTWVRVGALRTQLLAHIGDLVHDIVIAAPDRDFVSALIFPNPAAERRLGHAAFAERCRERLISFAAARSGSSTMIRRAIVLIEPPAIDAQELTDKGTVNQKAVLANRPAVVDALYSDDPPPAVIDVERMRAS